MYKNLFPFYVFSCNQGVPYKAVINGGLQPEKDIVVYGVPNPDSKM